MTIPFGSNAGPTIDVAKTVERARAAWAMGQADEAEMACRQVLAVWPGQTDSTYLIGLTAYTFGNLDLAIAHVREAWRAPRRAGPEAGEETESAAGHQFTTRLVDVDVPPCPAGTL